MTRSNQHDITETVRNALHSAENKSAHHDVAEIAVRLYETHQMLAIDIDYFAGFACPDLDEAAAAGKDVDFSGKHAVLKHCNQILTRPSRPHNFDFTADNHKDMRRLRAAFHQYIAALDLPQIAAGANAGNLRLR